MTKIDIFSGFLGAGKTTLIKKLIKEAFAGQQVVLIENEFGEIGIDGGFLKESGIQINELNAGCICCSLVGDFRTALQQVVEQYHPDRIVIERRRSVACILRGRTACRSLTVRCGACPLPNRCPPGPPVLLICRPKRENATKLQKMLQFFLEKGRFPIDRLAIIEM